MSGFLEEMASLDQTETVAERFGGVVKGNDVTISVEELRAIMRQAYWAGWATSGCGWNEEMQVFGVVGASVVWVKDRDKALKELAP